MSDLNGVSGLHTTFDLGLVYFLVLKHELDPSCELHAKS